MTCFKAKYILIAFASLLLSTLTSCNLKDSTIEPIVYQEINYPQMDKVSYLKEIQPIFNKRCVSCHSCYDAPAQLNLSCSDGVMRGATKKVVYDSLRLNDVQPTRMHQDAKTEEEWRKLGFFSVLGNRDAESVGERLKSSLIYQMISQSRFQRTPYNTPIAKLQRDSHDPAIAPTIEEFPEFAAKYPNAGMPYLTQRLSDKEFATISNWIAQGSPLEAEKVTLSQLEKNAIGQWEAFLNQDSLKSQLVSRYIYEHIYISHLYFVDIPGNSYFKIIRSKTPPGQPITPIITPLSNDDPGVDRVYYRIKKMHGIIKRKTHITYPLGTRRLARVKSLFETDDWDTEAQPDYSETNKVNPFITFSAIPAETRYKFMLDNAYFFVLSFIKGPVCRGQNALNAINDQFYIMFQYPKSPLALTDDTFLKENMSNMPLPGNIRSLLGFPVSFALITSARNSYLTKREEYLNKIYSNGVKVTVDDIWTGNEYSSDWGLTVFRHFDTASLMSGFIGDSPASAWVLDYPLFERIYYSLVVNYNIFSTAGHQAATRRYFDLLRHEAENNFLTYLPIESRQPIQDHWYRGLGLKGTIDYHSPSSVIDTSTVFSTDNHGIEFIDIVKKRGAKRNQNTIDRKIETVAKTIPAKLAPVIQFLPEMTLVKVTDPAPKAKEHVYTMIRNKAHQNVAYIFGEEARREPERDTVLIVKGITGDYPNLILVIPHDKLDQFKDEFHSADTEEKIEKLLIDYGILRNSPLFWQNVDWFQQYIPAENKRHYGLFDLKNYYIY